MVGVWREFRFERVKQGFEDLWVSGSAAYFSFELVTSVSFERKTRKGRQEQSVKNDHYPQILKIISNEVGVHYSEK